MSGSRQFSDYLCTGYTAVGGGAHGWVAGCLVPFLQDDLLWIYRESGIGGHSIAKFQRHLCAHLESSR
jgi:hypothetical protein